MTPSTDSAAPISAVDAAADSEPVEVEELLVEEVSIDGLCGVY